MTTGKESKRCLPPLLMEKWHLGELSEAREQKLIAEFGIECLTRELERLQLHDRQFFADHGGPGMEMPGRTRRRRSGWTALLAVAAALCLIVLSRIVPSDQDDILLKGDEAPLVIYQKSVSGIIRLTEQTALSANDMIQIAYYERQLPYGMIFSIDGRGRFTLHYPATEQDVGALRKGRRTFLDASYRLDDAPRGERFFFIRSFAPLAIPRLKEEIMASLTGKDALAIRRLELGTGWEQSTFLLAKKDTP